MTKKLTSGHLGRREFLKGLAVIGGTTVLVTVAKDAMADEPHEALADSVSEQKPAEETKGYRVTPHIQTYYDKAGF